MQEFAKGLPDMASLFSAVEDVAVATRAVLGEERVVIYFTDQRLLTDTWSMESPRTLQQAIIYFADYDNARNFLVGLRWEDGKVRCPHCGSDKVTHVAAAKLYKCYGKHPKAKFSLKVGTIFEDSALGLDKWLAAMWLIVNCKNGISSCEIARDLGITQKSAWQMAHRIRFALHEGSFENMLLVKSRPMRLSSAVRLATCTPTSRLGVLPGLARTIRLQ